MIIHNHLLGITHHDTQPLPVVVKHVVVCWSSGCESWCSILSQWLWIMVCYAEPVVVNYDVLCWTSQPLAQHSTPWFTGTGSALHTMIHNHWLRIINHVWQPLAQHSSPVYYSEPNGYEWWFIMMSQWLWIMVSYAEPVGINHGVLCWASGCESWCVMLRHSTPSFSTTGWA
jgi:hypothetical protein